MIRGKGAGSRPRIGQLLWCLHRGGAEVLLAQGMRVADHSQFEYSVAYLIPSKPELAEEFELAGVELVPLGFPNPAKLIPSMARWLRSLDLLHTHAPLPAALARLMSLVFGPRRRIYTEHGLGSSYNPVTRYAHYLTMGLEARLIAVSGAVKLAMPNKFRTDTEVLIHGIHSGRFDRSAVDRTTVRRTIGVRDDSLMMLVVANFKDEKDLRNLIDAVSIVESERADLDFVHVGGGHQEEEIHAYADEVGVGITFLGIRDDVPDLVMSSDALVLSSKAEGLPVTLMEGQIAGVPYVGTSAGGIPEAIEDGVNGLLVPSGDSQALASAILRFATDADLRQSVTEATISGSNRFSAQDSQRTLEEIYEGLLI